MKLFSLITMMTTQSAVTIQIGRRTWSAQQTLHGLGPTPLTGGLPVAMIPTELCTQITWKHPWQISTYLAHRPNQVHATSSNLWTSGGKKCLNCTAPLWYEKDESSLHTDSDKNICEFNGKTGAVYNEDNFGYYGAVNPLHRCSSGPNATTQVWLRGQWNDASSFIFSCTLRRYMIRIINSSWLHRNEDATLCIICDNYNRPQHSFLSTRADLGGGCRGCAPSPPSWDDLRFSDTTGILQKKKLCGLLVLK